MTSTVHFHGDDIKRFGLKNSLFHVIPVPYEKSVSYGSGTAKGPQAILDASCQLELFDSKSVPADLGIYTYPPVDCSGTESNALKGISSKVNIPLSLNKIPIVLGGEHTVTLASINALEQKHNTFGVIQFDAHADLRDIYQGNRYSHACVMKRIHDKNISLFQVGTRSYSLDEHHLRSKDKIPFYDAEDIHLHGIEKFSLPDNFPEKVFITFDIDALDSSLMPATGTPVPGGLNWFQAMSLLEKVIESRICIGFDVVEFSPISHQHAASFTAAQLVYNMMGFISRSKANSVFYQFSIQHRTLRKKV